MPQEATTASAALEAMLQGTLDIKDTFVRDKRQDADKPSPVSPGSPDEQSLEWHEVIELQAFSQRKEWIEEKIQFLENMPAVEVFGPLDTLPSRAELEEWFAEHDRIEKDIRIFDDGELRKLKKFTKAAAQRNLSPADTDLIELTLTTIYRLDRLLHLLTDRAANLQMLDIRLTWEDRRAAAWTEYHNLLADIRQFLATRARWSSAASEHAASITETLTETVSEPVPSRRSSIVSMTSMASDSSYLSLSGASRSSRYKYTEQLSREAAQLTSRLSSLRLSKIPVTAKTLDKWIARSRRSQRTIPDEFLDEQDRLENEVGSATDDVGRFVMSVVTQWTRADDIYAETSKDKAAVETLLEELDAALQAHPNPRLDAAFSSRISSLVKRISSRNNPASPSSMFPRPVHPLFPEQAEANETIVRLLSQELTSALEQARRVERQVNEYHSSVEAVKHAEATCKTARDISARFDSLTERLTEGLSSDNGDGTPPDLSTEACLEGTRHSFFVGMLPSMMQEIDAANSEVANASRAARAALLHLDRPGIDPQFKADCVGTVEQLFASHQQTAKAREEIMGRATALTAVRRIWTVMGHVFEDIYRLREQVAAAMVGSVWQQETDVHDAPPTPESPNAPSPPVAICHDTAAARLDQIEADLRDQVTVPLATLSPALGPPLLGYLTRCFTGLSTFLESVRNTAEVWDSIKMQTAIMEHVRDRFRELQGEIGDLNGRFDQWIPEVLDGGLSGEELLLVEGALTSDLKRCQESVRAYIDDLPRRVPFISQQTSSSSSISDTSDTWRPSSIPACTLDAVQQACSLGSPIDPTLADHAVRADSNAYTLTLSGSVKGIERKANHFQLAKIAQAVDEAIVAVQDSIRAVTETVSSIHNSFADHATPLGLEDLKHLSSDLEQLLQTEGPEIARSFSPLHGLLYRLRSQSHDDRPGASSDILTSRQRDVDDAEGQFASWKESTSLLQQRVSHAIHAEQARLTEQAFIDKEEHLKAKDVEDVAVQTTTVEVHKPDEELERQDTPELTIASVGTGGVEEETDTNITLVPEVLEPVEEWEGDKTIVLDRLDANDGDNIFGLRGLPLSPEPTVSAQAKALLDKISGLRRKLHSIHENEIAHPSSQSHDSLPSHDQCRRMDHQLTLINSITYDLPSTAQEPLVEAELQSLRVEIESSQELMQKLHSLAHLSDALVNCDNVLSDLLTHIDSYPSPPEMLLTSYTPDIALPPEGQLSARLEFTRGIIADLTSQYSDVADDPRATAEHDRVMQTWDELEAMAADRMDGTESRPISVMSSGRSSRASVSSSRSTLSVKRSSSNVNLSAEATHSQYLAPPRNARSTNGSSSASRNPRSVSTARSARSPSTARSISRASVTSASRSVSRPPSSALFGSTFSSRQRKTSVSSEAPVPVAVKQASSAVITRPRAHTGQSSRPKRVTSPARSEVPLLSHSRSVSRLSQSAQPSTSQRASWARAPRRSFPNNYTSSPLSKAKSTVKKPYVPDPKNKLDVAVGDVVNKLPVNINVEHAANTWKDRSGKYWIGDEDPKLCFCRILRSQTVMVRVGGGWTELSKFIKEHFADAFRILPDSPNLGSRDEKWISSSSLSQAAERFSPPNLPVTPEPRSPFVPSFSLSPPNGTSPQSIKSSSPGSPLNPLQYLRRPDTPSKAPRSGRTSALSAHGRQPVWRP
ncbi:uncharacterized protein LAESUDRAFT_30786 [Laetiporus sulphureus 93-53]|uniref:GAR domain-containing protein n=1 Tax=Laetiporus sulphureus 93-53 TaxID=1314785 RepID=A0A165IIY4_9APHY|nr:uncharacterized protein LAESUDRAFT_30786 [Laetiporus sulphureus 93-53]KZT13142.1 hypothetical protein LAESUDRAFT_30786 [Laetiporus sulphureus 93-53]